MINYTDHVTIEQTPAGVTVAFGQEIPNSTNGTAAHVVAHLGMSPDFARKLTQDLARTLGLRLEEPQA